MTEAINTARIAWMREQGAVHAQWNDAGELVSVTLGPPVPPAHVPEAYKPPVNPDIERRRMALAATPSLRRNP